MAGEIDENGGVSLEIQIDEPTADGVYANFAMLHHSETEFTLDFIHVQPQQGKAKVRSRVISSPRHTKRLLEALRENIERYEETFGEIDLSEDPAAGWGYN